MAREEKRLINALKNGVVLAEETAVAKTAPTPPPATAAAAATSSPPSSAKPQPQPAQKEPERDGATRWGPRNIKRPDQQVPHPELTTSQRQHIRQTAANPVRPFLTKGSVAERVLIFERCPSDLLLDKRVRAPVVQTPKPQVSEHTMSWDAGRVSMKVTDELFIIYIFVAVVCKFFKQGKTGSCLKCPNLYELVPSFIDESNLDNLSFYHD